MNPQKDEEISDAEMAIKGLASLLGLIVLAMMLSPMIYVVIKMWWWMFSKMIHGEL